MREHSVRRLPVVEKGHPAGIVSIGDMVIGRDAHSALGDISAAKPKPVGPRTEKLTGRSLSCTRRANSARGRATGSGRVGGGVPTALSRGGVRRLLRPA
ncbi:CBS domain-containing protein [Streptomyces puniciscabiei]|uniref:CBS domain-containing protein n=1 Tax=Streptomyces puniciscabiei TaxID=164348 RepID=UPI003EBC7CBA